MSGHAGVHAPVSAQGPAPAADRGTVRFVASAIHEGGAGGADPHARAMVVHRGRILWLGVDPREAPASDATIDLGDAHLVPGVVDAHVHGTAAGLAAGAVDLRGAGSSAHVLELVAAHVAEHPDDVAVLGRGWDESTWPERRPPSAEDLLAAGGGRPVVLHRVDLHACAVDAATLRSLDLRGLDVARDQEGAPTGWLREDAAGLAWRSVRARIPPSQLQSARERACADAVTLGITSFHELGVPGISDLDDALAWAGRRWPCRVDVWWGDLAVWREDGAALARRGLRPGGDLPLDGSIGSCTAATLAPYRCGDGSSTAGALVHDDADVVRLFVDATARGLPAGVHAIGDRAVDQALRALERAAEVHGLAAVRDARHRIEHVEVIDRARIARMARLGAVASVQPAFDATWGGPDGLYARRFGIEAALRTNPLRWFVDAGVTLAFGSDAPVTPLDPWGGVAAAEHHRGGLGLSRAEALLAATAGGHAAAGRDGGGRLAVGAPADAVAVDADPHAVEDIRALSVRATVVAGVIVHHDGRV